MATEPDSPTEACVVFAATIDDENVATAVAQLDALAAQNVSRVVLVLHTIGGNINAGMRLYERLREMPFALVTHAVGLVASMGIPIFLAGDERRAGPECEFLLHRAAFTAEAGKQFDIPLLKERLAMLEADEQRTRAIYEDRTSLTGEQVEALKAAETSMGAHEAAGHGIVHQVTAFAVPPGVSLVMIGGAIVPADQQA
jgi:ATP-dependent Clp protease, protease subunit